MMLSIITGKRHLVQCLSTCWCTHGLALWRGSPGSTENIIHIVTTLENTGTTSLTYRVEAKEEISGRKVASISRVVFVAVDDQGQPVPHSVNVEI